MIGKPKWFKYRIFGWGISPKTWQGYVYVAAIALILGVTMSIGINNMIKPWIIGIVFAVIMIDVMHIMIELSKVSDERENFHQLIIERNCSFAAIAALIGVALFQTFKNVDLLGTTGLPFDMTILIVLGAMFITKVASTFYIKMKM